MSAADVIALMLSSISIIWHGYNFYSDRTGKLSVEIHPDHQLTSPSRWSVQRPDGGVEYTKSSRKLQVSVTNKGREPRFIKACFLKVDDDQSYKIDELSGRKIEVGQIITHSLHPIDKLYEGRMVVVYAEDSLGKNYSSKKLPWKELE